MKYIGETGCNHIAEHRDGCLDEVNLTSLDLKPLYRKLLEINEDLTIILQQSYSSDGLQGRALRYQTPISLSAVCGKSNVLTSVRRA